VTDFVEMFRHWNAGRSQVQINEACRVHMSARDNIAHGPPVL
jgi:hypothetical protein